MANEPRSIHRGTVEAIAGWIIGGNYVAGTALPTEPEIGLRLGVSRTIVREAIRTLAAKGMVSVGPRVGTRVRPRAEWNPFDADIIRWRMRAGIDAAFIRDLIELRLTIEPAAAAIAATRAEPADIRRIDDAYRRMELASDIEGEWVPADLAFHGAILAGTHNQFFTALAPVIEAVLRVSFRLSVRSRDSARSSLPYHDTVRRAIAARDPIEAEAALRYLIISARKDIHTDGLMPEIVATDGEADAGTRH